jgi:DNA-binding CsgD family transcriptional regulator
MELNGFLSALSEAEQQQDITDLFQKEIEGFGYACFDAFSVEPTTLATPLKPGNWAVASYDFEIVKDYVLKGFTAICPALMEAGRSLVPFDYVDFLDRQPTDISVLAQRQWLKLWNVRHAWLVPLSTVGALKGVTVYMQGKSTDTGARFQASRHDIHLRSVYFFEALEAMRPGLPDGVEPTADTVTPLSTRELDCLKWAADGKTNWEIAQILGVSENTVRFHMKNVYRKLGVGSRSQAVARAIGQGLVAK